MEKEFPTLSGSSERPSLGGSAEPEKKINLVKQPAETGKPKTEPKAVELQPLTSTPKTDPIIQTDAVADKGKNHNIIIWLIPAVLVIALAAWCLFYFTGKPKTEQVPETIAVAEDVDPVIARLSAFGNVNMVGAFGSVPSSFVFDFSNNSGKRYYNSNPSDPYSLKLEKADIDQDGNYYLEFCDLLEGRIPIGTFKGIFNGKSYSGTYSSAQGKTRDFNFAIR